jgi:hypothetical protein
MLQVMDLAFRGFKARVEDDLVVGKLMHVEYPWQVVHDPTSQVSLVVDPEHVRSLVEKLGLDASVRLADSRILPYLAYGQMTALAGLPAWPVLAVAEWQNLGYVVVESDDHEPIGLVGLAHLYDVLPRGHLVQDAGLGEAVISALGDGGLTAAVVALDQEFGPGEFHSEQIMYSAPAAPWCDGATGHWVASCPCGPHPDATCARR